MKTTTPLERATALRAQTAAALTAAQRQRREADLSCERLAGGLATLDILIAGLNEAAPETPTVEAQPAPASASTP